MKPPLAESLLPGFGHLRRGYVAGGIRFLLFAVVWIAIVVFRLDVILGLPAAGEAEHWIALLFLVAFPVLLIWWAHRSLVHLVEPPSREGMGTWQLAWHAVKRNPRGVWGLMLLGFIYLLAFLAPVLSPYDPYAIPDETIVHKYRPPLSRILRFHHQDDGTIHAIGIEVRGPNAVLDRVARHAAKRVRLDQLTTPSEDWPRDEIEWLTLNGRAVPYVDEFHLLGTDSVGRDLLSRIVYGARISLLIGFTAMFVAVVIGVAFGAVAGYVGGFADGAIMRLVDVLLAFPRLLLLMLLVSVYENVSIWTVAIVLGATGWMGVSRLVRAQFLQLKELDYTNAARAFGFRLPRIMFRHLLPNAMAPVIVDATLRVGNTILVEAALSFLGFGVRPPTPSWGNIVADGRGVLENAWWIATIPGLLIVVTVICFNLVGDALRDALDPRQRH